MNSKRETRVLHIVPSLFADDGRIIGGAERYALELARHMADVVPTRLLSFGPHDYDGRIGRLRTRVVGRPWHVRGNKFNPLSTAIITEIMRADVIHCHQQYVMASSLSALLGRLCGRRVYCTEHGGGAWGISSYVSTDHWFHGHLHNSVFSRNVYDRERDPRAHVIYGGVDATRFSPGPAEPPRKNPAPALFVGRLLPHKGVNYLIEATPSELPLEVLGGAMNQQFLELLRHLAIGKDVRFTLDAPDEELVAAYRRALCVVLPSVYRSIDGRESRVPELLGQTLLEGMACGKPAICTAVGGMPEVVEDGVTGFVVPPNDPRSLRDRLVQLHSQPALARAMGAAARERVLRCFTWPATVERCLNIYRQLAASNGCP